MTQAEMMDLICKYKVGQLLTLEVDEHLGPTKGRNVYRVIERLVQQCYGGIQVHYKCSMHAVAVARYEANSIPGIGTDLRQLTEPEFVPFDEERFLSQYKSEEKA